MDELPYVYEANQELFQDVKALVWRQFNLFVDQFIKVSISQGVSNEIHLWGPIILKYPQFVYYSLSFKIRSKLSFSGLFLGLFEGNAF